MEFVQKTLIQKGWSGDRKFCATDAEGNRFLFRLSPPELLEKKQRQFRNM